MAAERRIETTNEELLSPREFQRKFGIKLQELLDCDLDKIVLMRHGKMIGVVLNIDAYIELIERAGG